MKLKLQELIDGVLPADVKIAVRKHLKICPQCAREYRFLQFTKKSVNNMADIKLSSGFNSKVMAALGFGTKPALIKNPFVWAALSVFAMSFCWLGVGALFLYAKYGFAGLADLASNPLQALSFAGTFFAAALVCVKQLANTANALVMVITPAVNVAKMLVLAGLSGFICISIAGVIASKKQKSILNAL